MERKWGKEGVQPRRLPTRKLPELPVRNSASDSMLIFPVFIPQQGCPFNCIYCNQESFGSVTETSSEDLLHQISSFCRKHKHKDKQIAFYGGTFTGLSIAEREAYIGLLKPFLDERTSIRISTRPDMVDSKRLDWCKAHQIKTIELGIQDFNDEVLRAAQRGYDKHTAIDSCLRVKLHGFELGVQLMPGLPCFSIASQKESVMALQGILPDFLRIYPLIILKGTPLWKEWEEGKVKPLNLEEAVNICVDYYDWADANGVQIIKLGIPSLGKDVEFVGPYHPAFGELVMGERLIRKIEAVYKPGMSIHISAGEISLLTGHKDYNLRKLLLRLNQKTVKILPDATLNKGEVSICAD